MIDRLIEFVERLRQTGIQVSLAEECDAAAAVDALGLSDRDQLRRALAVTLIKRADHLPVFDVLFDMFFSVVGLSGAAADQPEGLRALDQAALSELAYQAFTSGSADLLTQVSREYVERWSGFEPGRPVAGTQYIARTMSALDTGGLAQRFLPGDDAEPVGALTAEVRRRQFTSRVEVLRRHVESAVRERLVQDRGAVAVAAATAYTVPEDVDLMNADRATLQQLDVALDSLSRALTASLARKHRRRPTRLDYGRTARASMSYGGVPATLRWRRPRPIRPELIVLADVSGSVSAFATFTMQLLFALQASFSKIRCFAFTDDITEITHLFAEEATASAVSDRVGREAKTVWLDGHSDYGHSLTSFWERHGSQLHRRSTVIVLGDARNNYHLTNAHVLGAVKQGVHQIFWLNPEARRNWDDGDSVIGEYAVHCDAVAECRTLRQLRQFVERQL